MDDCGNVHFKQSFQATISRLISKIQLGLLTAGPFTTSDHCPRVPGIMRSLFLSPSPPGWCRWARSSVAVSQRSCRSPSNGRVSTTLNTITGKTPPLLSRHLDRVTIPWFLFIHRALRADRLDPLCLVPWDAVSWTAGYQRFTQTFHNHSHRLPWSRSLLSLSRHVITC